MSTKPPTADDIQPSDTGAWELVGPAGEYRGSYATRELARHFQKPGETIQREKVDGEHEA